MKKGYFLTEACKNTFVLFDCMMESALDDAFYRKVHACLVAEKRDDSLILVDGKEENGALYCKMLVLGLDGEFGEFCGNGSRTVAAYLYSNYPQYKCFYLVTKRGNHKLTNYGGGIYSTKLPHVLFDVNPKFIAKSVFKKEGQFYSITLNEKRFTYAEAIEPHLVIEAKMNDEELDSLGKELNQKRDIFPLGINLNAYQVLPGNTLHVKTYERGVQRLTRSCGTGSSCSSAHYLKGRPGSVKVETPGGALEIVLDLEGLELKGPATVEGFRALA